jgi:predicted HD phosphohydrolase
MAAVMSEKPSATFRRMDQGTPADWEIIRRETLGELPRVAERVLGLLRSLRDVRDGFAVDQLSHALQTAARAEKAGASDEMIAAALCHDIGKAISVFGHAEISASILAPFVSDETHWIISVHQDLQSRLYARYFDIPAASWQRHEGHPLYERALRFVDDWDQPSFDPDATTPPLEHYEPLVRAVFARPRRPKPERTGV